MRWGLARPLAATVPRSAAVTRPIGLASSARPTHRRNAWPDPSRDALEFFLNDIAKQFQQAAEDYQHNQSMYIQHDRHHRHKPASPNHKHPKNNHCCAISTTSDKPTTSSAEKSSSFEQQEAVDTVTSPLQVRARDHTTAATTLLELDVADNGHEYILFADVPGIGSAEDLTIQLTREQVSAATSKQLLQDEGTSAAGVTTARRQLMLTISGQRKMPAILSDAYKKQHCQQERSSVPFSRSWVLPHDADSNAIRAQVAWGVLTVHVPKIRQV